MPIGTTAATRGEVERYRSLMARLKAKANELKDDTPEREARRIEAEHLELCNQAEAIRYRLMGELVDEQDEIGAPSTGTIGVAGVHGSGVNDPIARAVTDGLYARMTGRPAEGQAREFANKSLLQIGAEILERRGERVASLGKSELAERLMQTRGFVADHGTSDFPNLLLAAGNRVLAESYKSAESPLKALARPRTANDFRAINLLRLSEAPKLLEIGEGAEVKHGTMAESKESFKIKTFARIFAISRTALINDDLSAFSDSSIAFGRSAAEAEASELVALLSANSGDGVNLDDGNPLFGVGRSNKAASGGALSVVTLGDARQALRSMTGLDGQTPVNAVPRFILVGAAGETAAEQVTTAIMATQFDNANPFAGKLSVLVEPRLSGNAWYVFADPAVMPILSFAYLSGFEGPQFAMREGFDVLGQEFRCTLDFGAGVTDFRGAFLNPGA